MVRLPFRRRDEVGQRVEEDVVAQHDQAAGALAIQLGQSEGLGDAAGLVLDAVGQTAAVAAAGAEQLDEVAHVFRAGH